MHKRSTVVLALLITLAAHRLSAQATTTVIDGGTLVDGRGGAPIKNSVIVIEGTRIKAVGAKGSVAIPPQARIIKADGMTVLPGLIDAHIHELDFFPQLFLHYGVTTVCDTANDTEWTIAQREALQKGKIKGPRLFVSGVVIDGPSKAADKRDDYLVHINTPAEARAMARGLLKRGVDVLKVYQNLTPDLLKPIVEEAHMAGTEAVGHSHDANDAIGVGLKFIEHMTPITHSTISDPAKLKAMDEGKLRNADADMDPKLFGPLIDLMVKNGVFMNPTLNRSNIGKRTEWNALAVAALEDPAYRFIPEARRINWLRTAKGEGERGGGERNDPARAAEGQRKTLEFLKMYAQAGGRFIAGPDSGPSSGPSNMAGLAMHLEMDALVDAGLTPMQAILSSTRWAAELLHKEKDLGTVAPGKIADILLIEGDPLADIRATQKIHLVMMDGKVIDTTLDPAFQNPVPRPTAEYPMDSRDPIADAMTPDAAHEGDASVAVSLTGSKFTRQSIVRVDTSDVPTTFVSATKLTATVPGALLKRAGAYAVTVTTPGPTGGVSKPLHLVVQPAGQAAGTRPAVDASSGKSDPVLDSMKADIAHEGDAHVAIVLNGHNLSRQSIIRFDTADLPATFVSESKLTATVPAALLKRAGTYAVTVTNPGPGGGVSQESYLVVHFR